MLNFNAFENMSPYAHSAIDASSRSTLNSGNSANFIGASTIPSAISLSVTTASTIPSNPSCQEQMSTNYLHDGLHLNKISEANSHKHLVNENLSSVNWSNSVNGNESHHTPSNNNNNNNNNVIVNNNNNNNNNSTIDSETFLLNHKGSENVKRFSVNNLLQLASCRAVTSLERAAAVTNGNKNYRKMIVKKVSQ